MITNVRGAWLTFPNYDIAVESRCGMHAHHFIIRGLRFCNCGGVNVHTGLIEGLKGGLCCRTIEDINLSTYES